MVLRLLKYLWASPATLLGLLPLPLLLLQGGRAQVIDGVVEMHGGAVRWLLDQRWYLISPLAMTLGHVIWGRDAQCLETSRRHEHVHVQQYEVWGPLMIPVYLLCSLYLYLRGYHPYLDNPFELEAFERTKAE